MTESAMDSWISWKLIDLIDYLKINELWLNQTWIVQISKPAEIGIAQKMHSDK
jgi:hypothetical protein